MPTTISHPPTVAPAATAAKPDGPPQYSPRRIAAVWAAAALPLTITAGLIWQFAIVVVLVAREQRSLRWSVVREALWLRAPRSPRTGRRGGRAWLILVPLIVALAAEEGVPQIPAPVHRDQGLFLQSVVG